MTLEVNIEKKLRDFTLHMEFTAANGCTGLMGPSGSGKSMTLKCIAGIVTPDHGRIVLGDQVLFDSEQRINLPPQKRSVGYLFQNYALFPNMTVAQNIEAGLKAQKMAKAERLATIQTFLAGFRLEELTQCYPRQLSGGQKQRAALARLMACRPEVILLDEPFSALDEELRQELQEELQQVVSSLEKPVLLVSHDSGEVARLSNRAIYKIKRGELIYREQLS